MSWRIHKLQLMVQYDWLSTFILKYYPSFYFESPPTLLRKLEPSFSLGDTLNRVFEGRM